MEVIDGTGQIVAEPDWGSLFDDELEIAAATGHWRVITTELRGRQLLSPANGEAIKNLVCAYIFRERNLREVAENGSVLRPKRGNSRAIARISPYHTAAREWMAEVIALEAELGISPRRRASATKVERRQKQERASDAYRSAAYR